MEILIAILFIWLILLSFYVLLKPIKIPEKKENGISFYNKYSLSPEFYSIHEVVQKLADKFLDMGPIEKSTWRIGIVDKEEKK